jgi:dihydroorotase-like cyclic amidohydrolase
VLLSVGVNGGRISLSQVAAVTRANPARILGLPGKGALLPGMDADLVVVDLDLERMVDAEMLGSAVANLSSAKASRLCTSVARALRPPSRAAPMSGS